MSYQERLAAAQGQVDSDARSQMFRYAPTRNSMITAAAEQYTPIDGETVAAILTEQHLWGQTIEDTALLGAVSSPLHLAQIVIQMQLEEDLHKYVIATYGDTTKAF